MISDKSQRLRELKGFGPRSEEIFAKLGIRTIDQFMQEDPYELYKRLKEEIKGTGLNSIYAILGAREGLHWLEISRTRKTEILMRLDDMGLAP
jgi:DNA transformation protein